MLEVGYFDGITLLSSCYFGRVVGFNDEGAPLELGRLLAIDDAPDLEVVPEGGYTILEP